MGSSADEVTIDWLSLRRSALSKIQNGYWIKSNEPEIYQVAIRIVPRNGAFFLSSNDIKLVLTRECDNKDIDVDMKEQPTHRDFTVTFKSKVCLQKLANGLGLLMRAVNNPF